MKNPIKATQPFELSPPPRYDAIFFEALAALEGEQVDLDEDANQGLGSWQRLSRR